MGDTLVAGYGCGAVGGRWLGGRTRMTQRREVMGRTLGGQLLERVVAVSGSGKGKEIGYQLARD